MNIEEIKHLRDYIHFKPTYVYLKQHIQTGKLYFGKTVKKNVESYSGSGVYWGNHIKSHGEGVQTLWYCLFTERDDLFDFCVSYSKINDIVKSCDYANMIDEIGFNGGTHGLKLNRNPFSHSESAKQRRRGKVRAVDANGNKLGLISVEDTRFISGEIVSVHGNSFSEETKIKISKSKSGVKMSKESSEKKRLSLSGRKQSPESIEARAKSLRGKAPAKCSVSGLYLGLISIDDPRWTSGEIVSNFKGVKKSRRVNIL